MSVYPRVRAKPGRGMVLVQSARGGPLSCQVPSGILASGSNRQHVGVGVRILAALAKAGSWGGHVSIHCAGPLDQGSRTKFQTMVRYRTDHQTRFRLRNFKTVRLLLVTVPRLHLFRASRLSDALSQPCICITS